MEVFRPLVLVSESRRLEIPLGHQIQGPGQGGTGGRERWKREETGRDGGREGERQRERERGEKGGRGRYMYMIKRLRNIFREL